MRYSSPPIIEIDTHSNEIHVSIDRKCLDSSSAFTSNKSSYFTIEIATALLLATSGTVSAPAALLTFLALKTNIAVLALDSDCMPTMDIVLEAPPYYLGSVDECRAEVENQEHCPNDFPAFPICSDPSPSCKLAIVGAGTGGLYSAMRLLDEGVYNGSDICVFEATERVGGRLYSLRGFGPDGDLTVDAGGYRELI